MTPCDTLADRVIDALYHGLFTAALNMVRHPTVAGLPCPGLDRAACVAAYRGALDVYLVLVAVPGVDVPATVAPAARGGHTPVVAAALRDPRCSIGPEVLRAAAASGNPEVLALVLADNRAHLTAALLREALPYCASRSMRAMLLATAPKK